MNVENQQAITNQSLIQSPFTRMTLPIARNFNEYMKYSKDENLKRIFSRLASGSVSYNSEHTKKMSELYVQMKKIYATTEICEPNDKKTCYTLSPYLERTMQIEKDYDRLIWAWKGWHDGCGNQIRRLYLPFINLLNNNTKENGYKDLSVS
jgi:peptidyl-dipeptidase A